MKKIIISFLILSFLVGMTPVYAAQGGTKGASSRAYEHASDQAVFHRISDWFATRGKSDQEKQAILAERKAKRAAKRLQKEAEKKKKQLKKEAKKAQKKIRKQQKGSKKGSR
jgi:hypothetical protein